MTILSNAFYFIIALGILVTIHEFGHFWVARKLGVRVLKFSIGFGTPIWQRTATDGVVYAIGLIPLGGYVKMLDERDSEVHHADTHQAFNRKPVWVRFAIVAAGPIANFLLAIALYWWVFGLGIQSLNTEVGQVTPQSIADKAGVAAGDVITEVDGVAVHSISTLIRRLALRLGENTELVLTVQNQKSSEPQRLILSLQGWKVDDSNPDILGSLGIVHPIVLDRPAVLEVILENMPASKSGLKPGDEVKSIDGVEVTFWSDLVRLVEKRAAKKVNITVDRKGELIDISVVIGSRDVNGESKGFLGVSQDSSEFFVLRKGDGMLDALQIAAAETWDMIALSVQLFGKLLVGDLSLKSLSGPFKIAEGAGGSARIGLVNFLSFVAMVSVNLGFINLLPVPLLDGGHLLYFSIEAVRGKPLSERVQEAGLQVGMLLVFTLMAIAIFNDISQTIMR